MASGGGYEVAYNDIRNLQNSWSSEEATIRSMATRLQSMLTEIATAEQEGISRAEAAVSMARSNNSAEAAHARAQAQAKIGRITSLAKTARADVENAMAAVNALSRQLSEDGDKLAATAATYQRAEQAATDNVTGGAQLASYTSRAGGAGGGYSGTGGYSGGAGGSGFAGVGAGGGSGGGTYSGGGVGTPVAPNAAASSPQVDAWVKEAIKELEKEGIPASKLDPNAIKLIIMHESGGDPSIVNHWDSNAAAGHPSEGLMQTIAPTFQQYSSPGHGNILNPVDNIMAGCKYAIARYGSLDNVPGVVAVQQGGSYVGY